MFGADELDPWIGPNFATTDPKILVIGESRWDDNSDWTDCLIIKHRVDGERHRTFTNFVQAATGVHHSDPAYDAIEFWNRVAFYNYNRKAFPGGPQIALSEEERNHPKNLECLRIILETLSPSHAIVWGKKNWSYVHVEGHCWEEQSNPIHTESIEGEVCFMPVMGRRVLFTYTHHPSWPRFSWGRWHPVLKEFVSMRG